MLKKLYFTRLNPHLPDLGWTLGISLYPAAERDHAPNAFDQAERPGTLQEAIGRPKNAGKGKGPNDHRSYG
jgi:hypothetical protein